MVGMKWRYPVHCADVSERSRWSQGILKGGSITVPLTSCLTGSELAVWQLTIFYFIFKTDLSKPVKQEVNGTVILPLLVFHGEANNMWVSVAERGRGGREGERGRRWSHQGLSGVWVLKGNGWAWLQIKMKLQDLSLFQNFLKINLR